ncbi:CPBP family intramembrane glutamic endopeptidase [Roseibium sp. SCPC15]|uniref:CPBP family intramembrane glutamic endopeptidase n=1 Tax=Roseibium sp. SCP15 TaxID=3141376 RepID=UPI00333842B5
MFLTSSAYAVLALAIVLALTLRSSPIALVAFSIACALGLLAGLLHVSAAVSILLIGVLTFLVFGKAPNRQVRLVSTVLLLVTGHLVMIHALPGFDNLKVLSGVQVSPNGIPYSMYLNFDKAVLGFFLVLFAAEPLKSRSELNACVRAAATWFAPTAGLLILLAYLAGLVVFDPKIPSFLPVWIFSNLLITCVAEEAFFRRFVLAELGKHAGSERIRNAIALILSSLFFAYYHLNGGLLFAGFSLVAGLCYGAAYLRTNRVEVAILVHFLVNLTHILFFTYPFLATSVGLQ